MATMVVKSKINSRIIISISQGGVNHGGYHPTIKQRVNGDNNICSQFHPKIKKGSTLDSHHTFCDIFKVQSHWPPDGITCKSHTQKIPANLTRTILLRAHQWNSQYQGNEKILGFRHFEDWLMDEQYCRYTWPQFLRFISFQRRLIKGRYQIF